MAATTESPRLRLFRERHAAMVEAFNRGDFETAFGGVRDDFELHFPPGFPQRVLRGRRQLVGFYREFREDLGGWRLRPREYLEAGPRTFVIGFENEGVGRSSGLPAVAGVWDVLEVDEHDRPLRAREFFDRSEALRAAGLEESEGPS
jgi:hypothetical protein